MEVNHEEELFKQVRRKYRAERRRVEGAEAVYLKKGLSYPILNPSLCLTLCLAQNRLLNC